MDVLMSHQNSPLGVVTVLLLAVVGFKFGLGRDRGHSDRQDQVLAVLAQWSHSESALH